MGVDIPEVSSSGNAGGGVRAALRTFFYIDGLNLYYGALRHSPYRWLNLVVFCQNLARLAPPKIRLAVVRVKYFTAPVKELPWDEDAPRRQKTYLNALEATGGGALQIVRGNFRKGQPGVKARDYANWRIMRTVYKPEEKGTDVNLAVHLVNDCWEDSFDCAVVISNDGDLTGALQIVERRRKLLIAIAPIYKRPDRRPIKSFDEWTHLRLPSGDAAARDAALGAALAKSQLPPRVAAKNRRGVNVVFERPAAWAQGKRKTI
jgi:uncharacterized LabA/DUF88 family protein